jgi:hypothetical protein
VNFSVTFINPRTYAVKTPVTNLSSLEFVHVTRKGTSPVFVCAFGSNCGRTTVKVAKKTTKKTLCVHEQVIQMVENETNQTEYIKPAETPSNHGQSSADVEEESNQSIWLNNTARFLYENCKMDLSFKSMRIIEREILEIENSADGFPVVFQVRDLVMHFCLYPGKLFSRVNLLIFVLKTRLGKALRKITQCNKYGTAVDKI